MSKSYDDVIFGGDFNTDFSRNTPATRKLSMFLIECGVVDAADSSDADVTYTFKAEGRACTSLIDHFFI